MESVDALLQALSRTRVAIASQAGSEIEAIRNVAGAVKAVLEVSDGQIAEALDTQKQQLNLVAVELIGAAKELATDENAGDRIVVHTFTMEAIANKIKGLLSGETAAPARAKAVLAPSSGGGDGRVRATAQMAPTASAASATPSAGGAGGIGDEAVVLAAREVLVTISAQVDAAMRQEGAAVAAGASSAVGAVKALMDACKALLRQLPASGARSTLEATMRKVYAATVEVINASEPASLMPPPDGAVDTLHQASSTVAVSIRELLVACKAGRDALASGSRPAVATVAASSSGGQSAASGSGSIDVATMRLRLQEVSELTVQIDRIASAIQVERDPEQHEMWVSMNEAINTHCAALAEAARAWTANRDDARREAQLQQALATVEGITRSALTVALRDQVVTELKNQRNAAAFMAADVGPEEATALKALTVVCESVAYLVGAVTSDASAVGPLSSRVEQSLDLLRALPDLKTVTATITDIIEATELIGVLTRTCAASNADIAANRDLNAKIAELTEFVKLITTELSRRDSVAEAERSIMEEMESVQRISLQERQLKAISKAQERRQKRIDSKANRLMKRAEDAAVIARETTRNRAMSNAGFHESAALEAARAFENRLRSNRSQTVLARKVKRPEPVAAVVVAAPAEVDELETSVVSEVSLTTLECSDPDMEDALVVAVTAAESGTSNVSAGMTAGSTGSASGGGMLAPPAVLSRKEARQQEKTTQFLLKRDEIHDTVLVDLEVLVEARDEMRELVSLALFSIGELNEQVRVVQAEEIVRMIVDVQTALQALPLDANRWEPLVLTHGPASKFWIGSVGKTLSSALVRFATAKAAVLSDHTAVSEHELLGAATEISSVIVRIPDYMEWEVLQMGLRYASRVATEMEAIAGPGHQRVIAQLALVAASSAEVISTAVYLPQHVGNAIDDTNSYVAAFCAQVQAFTQLSPEEVVEETNSPIRVLASARAICFAIDDLIRSCRLALASGRKIHIKYATERLASAFYEALGGDDHDVMGIGGIGADPVAAAEGEGLNGAHLVSIMLELGSRLTRVVTSINSQSVASMAAAIKALSLVGTKLMAFTSEIDNGAMNAALDTAFNAAVDAMAAYVDDPSSASSRSGVTDSLRAVTDAVSRTVVGVTIPAIKKDLTHVADAIVRQGLQDTASLSATTLPIVKGVRHVAMAVLNAFDAASVSAGVELIHDAISRLSAAVKVAGRVSQDTNGQRKIVFQLNIITSSQTKVTTCLRAVLLSENVTVRTYRTLNSSVVAMVAALKGILALTSSLAL